MSRKYKILLFEEPEGGYSVEVPELPGCFTQGESLDEAIANAQEAIAGYLETLDLINAQVEEGDRHDYAPRPRRRS